MQHLGNSRVKTRVNPENDSLAFSLVNCLGVNGQPIFNYLFPDEVAPGANNVVTLDSSTGELTWCSPQMPGLYSVCMLQEEYDSVGFKGSVLREIMFCIDAVTSLSEAKDHKGSVIVYPNPATHQFTVSGLPAGQAGITNYPAEISLFDITGRIVLSQTIRQHEPVDVSHLPNGIYLYQIKTPHINYVRGKLVKH